MVKDRIGMGGPEPHCHVWSRTTLPECGPGPHSGNIREREHILVDAVGDQALSCVVHDCSGLLGTNCSSALLAYALRPSTTLPAPIQESMTCKTKACDTFVQYEAD